MPKKKLAPQDSAQGRTRPTKSGRVNTQNPADKSTTLYTMSGAMTTIEERDNRSEEERIAELRSKLFTLFDEEEDRERKDLRSSGIRGFLRRTDDTADDDQDDHLKKRSTGTFSKIKNMIGGSDEYDDVSNSRGEPQEGVRRGEPTPKRAQPQRTQQPHGDGAQPQSQRSAVQPKRSPSPRGGAQPQRGLAPEDYAAYPQRVEQERRVPPVNPVKAITPDKLETYETASREGVPLTDLDAAAAQPQTRRGRPSKAAGTAESAASRGGALKAQGEAENQRTTKRRPSRALGEQEDSPKRRPVRATSADDDSVQAKIAKRTSRAGARSKDSHDEDMVPPGGVAKRRGRKGATQGSGQERVFEAPQRARRKPYTAPTEPDAQDVARVHGRDTARQAQAHADASERNSTSTGLDTSFRLNDLYKDREPGILSQWESHDDIDRRMQERRAKRRAEAAKRTNYGTEDVSKMKTAAALYMVREGLKSGFGKVSGAFGHNVADIEAEEREAERALRQIANARDREDDVLPVPAIEAERAVTRKPEMFEAHDGALNDKLDELFEDMQLGEMTDYVAEVKPMRMARKAAAVEQDMSDIVEEDDREDFTDSMSPKASRKKGKAKAEIPVDEGFENDPDSDFDDEENALPVNENTDDYAGYADEENREEEPSRNEPILRKHYDDEEFDIANFFAVFRNPKRPEGSTLAWLIGSAAGAVAVIIIALMLVNGNTEQAVAVTGADALVESAKHVGSALAGIVQHI